MKVFKYSIPGICEFSIPMPIGAMPLSVGVQNGDPYFWALVDPDAEIEPKRFVAVMTGQTIIPTGRFIGTFQLGGDFGSMGPFVGHLFEAAT